MKMKDIILHKKYRRILSVTAVFLLMAMLLCACSGKGKNSENSKEEDEDNIREIEAGTSQDETEKAELFSEEAEHNGESGREDTDNPKAEMPDGIAVTGEGYQLILPEEWKDLYCLTEFSSAESQMQTVHHLKSYESGCGGTLFSISSFDKWSDFVGAPSYEVLGKLTDPSGKSVLLVAQFPTDVQADPDYLEEYSGMYEQAEEVLGSMRAAEGYTLEPVDPEERDAALRAFADWEAVSLLVDLNMMPDYSTAVDESWDMGEMHNNRFAVCDVDGDGAEELLISIQDTYIADQREEIWFYDTAEVEWYCKGAVYPGSEYYDNGTIRNIAAHNQTMGELWPFSVEKYFPEDSRYHFCCYVESWEKSVGETAFDGTAFPDEIDRDKDGVVYGISDENYNVTWIDGAEYDDLMKKYFGEAGTIAIDWQACTGRSVQKLETAMKQW